jgi:hypothetical protein
LPVQGSQLIASLLKNFPGEFRSLLKKTAKPPAPWPIPKMVDYDPKKKSFSLDEKQPLKQPDWTFEETLKKSGT